MERFPLRLHRFPAARAGALVALGWTLALGTVTGLARPSPVSASARHVMPPVATAARSKAVVRLHQRQVQVTIHNFAFAPAQLVVSPNTRVVWINRDFDPHTVTSDHGVWASGALDTGNRFARVFKTTGTYPYHCQIHPYMHGTIIVKR
jgi:plastocyanin